MAGFIKTFYRVFSFPVKFAKLRVVSIIETQTTSGELYSNYVIIY
jgi:hypothetical protein